MLTVQKIVGPVPYGYMLSREGTMPYVVIFVLCSMIGDGNSFFFILMKLFHHRCLTFIFIHYPYFITFGLIQPSTRTLIFPQLRQHTSNITAKKNSENELRDVRVKKKNKIVHCANKC